MGWFPYSKLQLLVFLLVLYLIFLILLLTIETFLQKLLNMYKHKKPLAKNILRKWPPTALFRLSFFNPIYINVAYYSSQTESLQLFDDLITPIPH